MAVVKNGVKQTQGILMIDMNIGNVLQHFVIKKQMKNL